MKTLLNSTTKVVKSLEADILQRQTLPAGFSLDQPDAGLVIDNSNLR